MNNLKGNSTGFVKNITKKHFQNFGQLFIVV